MRAEFERCVESRKLLKMQPDEEIACAEFSEAERDLVSAADDFDRGTWKWATDKAYYSMFHAARALLHLKGYKEQSHTCLIVAIEELFVNEGSLERKFLDFLISGKKRREDAIYASRYSKEIAEAHIAAAREFLDVVKKILDDANRR